MAETAVILGATSGVAQALARALVARHVPLILVARNADQLARVEQDLVARGGQVSTVLADLAQLEEHESLMPKIQQGHSFYVLYGSLPDQSACEADWSLAASALMTNFTSAASLLQRLALVCEARHSGHLVVVGSVAGDRGRGSNYIYGTAKGALESLCQGLRNRLARVDVPVLLVKPGFIDTPMTAAIAKQPALLWASPERVAGDILRAVDRGRNVKYTPWFWWPIMLIIRAIPEPVFKRMTL